MNHASPRPALVALLFGCGCLQTWLLQPAAAQSPGEGLGTREQSIIQARSSSLSQAANRFAAGSVSDGEQALFAGIEQKKSTPGWHEEAGQRLFGLAIRLRSERQPAAAMNAASSAIRQFDQAATLALARNNLVLAARAHEQAGAIHEHFQGDFRAAAARLKESARLDPAGKTNRRSAERLNQIVADLDRKSAGR